MNIFHRIGNGLEGLLSSSSSSGKESLNYNFLACAGFLLAIAFAGLVTWALRGILTLEALTLIAGVVKTFLWVYAGITIARIAGNAFIVLDRQRLAYRDGSLDANDEKALESADVGARMTTVPAVVRMAETAGAPKA